MEIKLASYDSVIVYFGNEISQDISKKVKDFSDSIKEIKGFSQIIPSYTSILITYDIFIFSYEEICKVLNNVQINKSNENTSKLIEIPVYYGIEVGFDLPRISEEKNLSIKEIIELHSNEIYKVYAIGFSPGFAYMGEVNEKINVNRLKNPRSKIPKNSVAIANKQTAVYPSDSPGGWNIIGKTPLEMFDKNLKSLCPVCVGDEVKFKSINKEEFLSLGGVL